MTKGKAFNKEDVCAAVKAAWSEYPAEKLSRAFETKRRVAECIIEDKGGNNFVLPHFRKSRKSK